MSTNDRNTTSIGISETKEGLEGSSQQYDDRHHADQAGLRDPSAADADHKKNVAWLEKPLAGKPHNVLRRLGREYAIKHQLGDEEDVRAFELGACLAQDPSKYSKVAGLRPDELEALEKEVTHRWSQPRLMYVVIVLCSVCAAVQGMGESTAFPRERSGPLTAHQTKRSSTALNSFTDISLVLASRMSPGRPGSQACSIAPRISAAPSLAAGSLFLLTMSLVRYSTLPHVRYPCHSYVFFSRLLIWSLVDITDKYQDVVVRFS